MIREYGGLLAFDAALLVTGTSFLVGVGIVTTRRAAVSLAGLAFTAGWALYGVVATWLLTAGSPLGVGIALAVCAALAAAALALRGRLPRLSSPARRRGGAGHFLGAAFGALLCAYLAVLCWRSVPGEADTNWDTWAFWLPKAKSLYYFHGLDNGPGGFTHFANRDYPPLGPALEATNYHFMGGTPAAPLQLQHWLVVVAFFAALAALLAPRVPPAVLGPSLAALAFMPLFDFYVGSSLPDESIGVLVALAAVCGALWLLERTTAYALIALVLTTAATLLKNEGLVFGLAALALVAGVAWRERRRALALALVVVPIVSLAPWKLWLVAHGLPASSQYYNVSDLAPSHLLAARSRLVTSTAHLAVYLLAPNRWLLVVPLAVAATALTFRRRPLLAWLPVVFVALSLAGLLVIYWIGNIPIGFWLVTSGDRTVMTIVMACGALTPLLIGESLSIRPCASPS